MNIKPIASIVDKAERFKSLRESLHTRYEMNDTTDFTKDYKDLASMAEDIFQECMTIETDTLLKSTTLSQEQKEQVSPELDKVVSTVNTIATGVGVLKSPSNYNTLEKLSSLTTLTELLKYEMRAVTHEVKYLENNGSSELSMS